MAEFDRWYLLLEVRGHTSKSLSVNMSTAGPLVRSNNRSVLTLILHALLSSILIIYQAYH